MPIRWSALKVQDATEMAEEFIAKMKEPAESVKTIAEEALKIPEIPEYIQGGFRSLISEAERILGGVQGWSKEPYSGNFDKIVERIRKEIPADALASEQKTAAAGSQQSLLV